MKKHRRDHQITVIEQNPSGATYGFGVTIGGSARERMKTADSEVHNALAALMYFNNKQRICLDNDEALIEYAAYGGAIERLQLLKVLQDACTDLGVVIEHGRRIEDLSEFEGYDLVVGADGPNSIVRGSANQAFETESYELTNRFAWFGVNKALTPNALVFRHSGENVFVAHYYAYSETKSTFVAECDGHTWLNGGFAEMSSPQRKAFIENIFADHLRGEPLVENKSVWGAFRVITNHQWYRSNRVLLGDALRRAHPTIGSGTRLAMDDALALFDAFVEHGDDLWRALPRYVEKRKPIRDLFGDATERSFNWYEKVREAMQANSAWDFAYGFITRTGRVDAKRLKEYAPGFYAGYMQYKRGRDYEVLSKL
jgi:2-polyprenyl-6-methoxyphenol hydroxylase-like FAD-dependent oxidoreductase